MVRGLSDYIQQDSRQIPFYFQSSTKFTELSSNGAQFCDIVNSFSNVFGGAHSNHTYPADLYYKINLSSHINLNNISN